MPAAPKMSVLKLSTKFTQHISISLDEEDDTEAPYAPVSPKAFEPNLEHDSVANREVKVRQADPNHLNIAWTLIRRKSKLKFLT